ncbi:MAG: S1/P1 nuclease [Chthoniobacterales bacterium]
MTLSRWLVAASALWFSAAAHAYGPIGHQIVGAIADERLAGTPTSKKIAALLDGLTLQKAAVIPDEIKGWDNGVDAPGIFRYSSRPQVDAQLAEFWRANPPTHDRTSTIPSHHWFHYTDVPLLGAQRYADGKAGRTPWDIVHMMNYCVRVLRGEEPEENPRKITMAVAIILLAHYVGDIHQPLHVGAEYFNGQGQPTDPDRDASALEDQGGNTITLELGAVAAEKLNVTQAKLHGFWDGKTVDLNLPILPKEMPKEERRAQTDAAMKALVRELATTEPKGWRLPPAVKLDNYAESWANEILPIAREAHDRLQFSGIHRQEEETEAFATGMAKEKKAPDGLSYEEWAAKVVRAELQRAGWRLAELLEQALQ